MSKVIIVGISDINTLAAIRCFGKNSVDSIVIIHGDYKNLSEAKITKSKYVQDAYLVANTQEAIFEMTYDLAKDYPEKTILFPCSDLAAYTFDFYYNKLKDKCITSGFKNNPGEVIKLMDKYNQKKFADEHGIKMAKSYHVDLIHYEQATEIQFPCILKPEVSAKGKKGDIRICLNLSEYSCAIREFIDNGYLEVLQQEYINKDYEVCALGCILDSPYGIEIKGVMKKIRESEKRGGGSTTFGEFINDDFIVKEVNNILKLLFELGYRGQYDMDFFVCGEEVYLNEINFRHSGNGYSLVCNKVDAPYYYFLWGSGEQISKNALFKPKTGNYIMNEVADFKVFPDYGISLLKWLGDFRSVSAFSVLDIHDIKGTIAILGERFGNLLKKTFKKTKLMY